MLNHPFDTHTAAEAEHALALPVAAGGLSSAKPAGTGYVNRAVIQVQGGSIRFRTTAPDATATTGRIAPDGSQIIVGQSELSRFSAVVNAGTPSLWVVWE
jgi:hypothetical protein